MKMIFPLNKSNAKDDYGFVTNFLKLHREYLVCPIMQLLNLSIRDSVVQTKSTKLLKFNFSTQALSWFRSCLTDREQCVVVINDLFDVCKGVNAQLYVDDAVIFTPREKHDRGCSNTQNING